VHLDMIGNAALLVVEDRGPGVAPRDRIRIFNAFERAHVATGAGGAGIGLSIVKQIVEDHRGAVWVEQGADGGGSRFVVRLPLDHEASRETDRVSLAG
jgi:signal transduction histidine kinase